MIVSPTGGSTTGGSSTPPSAGFATHESSVTPVPAATTKYTSCVPVTVESALAVLVVIVLFLSNLNAATLSPVAESSLISSIPAVLAETFALNSDTPLAKFTFLIAT